MLLQLTINKVTVFEVDIEDGDEYRLDFRKSVGDKTVRFLEGELTEFDKFRRLYPGKKRGNDTEFKNFRKHKDWREVLPHLCSILTVQAKQRDRDKFNNKFVPEWANLQTWINQRRWELECEPEKKYAPLGKQLNFNEI